MKHKKSSKNADAATRKSPKSSQEEAKEQAENVQIQINLFTSDGFVSPISIPSTTVLDAQENHKANSESESTEIEQKESEEWIDLKSWTVAKKRRESLEDKPTNIIEENQPMKTLTVNTIDDDDEPNIAILCESTPVTPISATQVEDETDKEDEFERRFHEALTGFWNLHAISTEFKLLSSSSTLDLTTYLPVYLLFIRTIRPTFSYAQAYTCALRDFKRDSRKTRGRISYLSYTSSLQSLVEETTESRDSKVNCEFLEELYAKIAPVINEHHPKRSSYEEIQSTIFALTTDDEKMRKHREERLEKEKRRKEREKQKMDLKRMLRNKTRPIVYPATYDLMEEKSQENIMSDESQREPIVSVHSAMPPSQPPRIMIRNKSVSIIRSDKQTGGNADTVIYRQKQGKSSTNQPNNDGKAPFKHSHILHSKYKTYKTAEEENNQVDADLQNNQMASTADMNDQLKISRVQTSSWAARLAEYQPIWRKNSQLNDYFLQSRQAQEIWESESSSLNHSRVEPIHLLHSTLERPHTAPCPTGKIEKQKPPQQLDAPNTMREKKSSQLHILRSQSRPQTAQHQRASQHPESTRLAALTQQRWHQLTPKDRANFVKTNKLFQPDPLTSQKSTQREVENAVRGVVLNRSYRLPAWAEEST